MKGGEVIVQIGAKLASSFGATIGQAIKKVSQAFSGGGAAGIAGGGFAAAAQAISGAVDLIKEAVVAMVNALDQASARANDLRASNKATNPAAAGFGADQYDQKLDRFAAKAATQFRHTKEEIHGAIVTAKGLGVPAEHLEAVTKAAIALQAANPAMTLQDAARAAAEATGGNVDGLRNALPGQFRNLGDADVWNRFNAGVPRMLQAAETRAEGISGLINAMKVRGGELLELKPGNAFATIGADVTEADKSAGSAAAKLATLRTRHQELLDKRDRLWASG